MDYKRAAKLLNISVGTVYNWVKSGKLHAIKTENGELDISEESVNSILGKYEKEANLFKTEREIKSYLKEKELRLLKKINGFCNRYSELYEDGNAEAAILWAEKITVQVNELQQIKQAYNLIAEAIMENITPLEEPYEEGEENE